MKRKTFDFAIVVSESGLHICVDDILTGMEAFQLIKELQSALFEFKKLTKRSIDEVSQRS